jgi:hypothetical protein
MSANKQHVGAIGWLLRALIAVPILVLVLPLVIVVLVVYFLAGIFLHIVAWFWCVRGRNVLLVYSDSPIWHDYIEQYFLPRVADRAIVLNWSQRRHWRRTLPVLAFRYFGGSRDHTPIAVVFRPFQIARVFRFYKPFHDFKHGRTEPLTAMENEFFALLETNGRI